MDSSIIVLQNDVLILNGKENKEAGAIYFELRVPRKKGKEIFWKVPSKIYGINLKDLFIKNRTKHNSNALLSLVRIFIF